MNKITCTPPVQLKSLPDESFVCDYCRDMELVLAGVDLSNEATRYWVIYSLSVSMHVWLENPAADADAEDLEIVGKVFYHTENRVESSLAHLIFYWKHPEKTSITLSRQRSC